MFFAIHPFLLNFAEKFKSVFLDTRGVRDNGLIFIAKMALVMFLSFQECKSVKKLGAYPTGD
jgi:hypothetical protein